MNTRLFVSAVEGYFGLRVRSQVTGRDYRTAEIPASAPDNIVIEEVFGRNIPRIDHIADLHSGNTLYICHVDAYVCTCAGGRLR